MLVILEDSSRDVRESSAMKDMTTGPRAAGDGLQLDLCRRPKPDGTKDPAGEAGWYLQRERERRGESLDQAGETAGIHPYHVEAIEYGDMTRMPLRLEALEMIGIYAQYLGFDPEPLVRHYAHFLPRPRIVPKAPHPANPAPLTSAKVVKFGKLPKFPKFDFQLSRMPAGTGGWVASLTGAALLFAGAAWMLLPAYEPAAVQNQVADPVDPMPTASTGPEAAQVKIYEEPMPDAQPGLTQLAEDEQAGTNLDGLTALIEEKIEPPGAPPAEVSSVAAAEDMTRTSEGRVFGAKSGGGRLVLKAKAPVWVRIEDAEGNVVMTQMLMGGDTYQVPERKGLVVIARDGGLLSYVIDGEEKGILGTPGEILVGRPLDIEKLGGNG